LSASRSSRHGWRDLALFLEAIGSLALARVAVRTLPFRFIARRLGEHMAESSREFAGGETPGLVAWAVSAAARRTPWRSKCLEQAIATKLMLRRRAVPCTVYFGVARPADAHAWVRVGSRTVIGGGETDRYAVVASFADLDTT
jgi:hypothetical protein